MLTSCGNRSCRGARSRPGHSRIQRTCGRFFRTWVSLAPVVSVLGTVLFLTIGFVATAMASDALPTLDELLDLTSPSVPRSVEPADGRPSRPTVRDPLSDTTDVSSVFKAALVDMEKASFELGNQLDPGVSAQRHQEAALLKLDALINEAQRQCQAYSKRGSSSGTGRAAEKGSEPMRSASAAAKSTSGMENPGVPTRGQVGPVHSDVKPIQEARSEWGNLPPRLRDQLIQGMRDRFSAVYRTLTEAYYQRLAEEDEP